MYGITDEDQSPTPPKSFEIEERKSFHLFKQMRRRIKADDKKEAKLNTKIKAVDEFAQAEAQVPSHFNTSNITVILFHSECTIQVSQFAQVVAKDNAQETNMIGAVVPERGPPGPPGLPVCCICCKHARLHTTYACNSHS